MKARNDVQDKEFTPLFFQVHLAPGRLVYKQKVLWRLWKWRQRRRVNRIQNRRKDGTFQLHKGGKEVHVYFWLYMSKILFPVNILLKVLNNFFFVVVIGELLNMQSLKVLEENRKKKKTNIAKFRFQLRKLILGANCRTHASWVSIHWRQVNWPGI